MKKIILSLSLVFCLAQLQANTSNGSGSTGHSELNTQKTTPKQPITIYGRAKIEGNMVTCLGGRRLCAVIPQKVEDDTNVFSDSIIIYNEDGGVIGEYTFSEISISENAEGTTITWIP